MTDKLIFSVDEDAVLRADEAWRQAAQLQRIREYWTDGKQLGSRSLVTGMSIKDQPYRTSSGEVIEP
jgi:hypothetical protein